MMTCQANLMVTLLHSAVVAVGHVRQRVQERAVVRESVPAQICSVDKSEGAWQSSLHSVHNLSLCLISFRLWP